MMPKGRYEIMTRLHAEGRRLGLDMMYRTCTVQAEPRLLLPKPTW